MNTNRNTNVNTNASENENKSDSHLQMQMRVRMRVQMRVIRIRDSGGGDVFFGLAAAGILSILTQFSKIFSTLYPHSTLPTHSATI